MASRVKELTKLPLSITEEGKIYHPSRTEITPKIKTGKMPETPKIIPCINLLLKRNKQHVTNNKKIPS
jgi:hypothetical protein